MRGATTTAKIADSKVAIVGGSITGCATYHALKSILKEPPTIFERSSKELEDRGMGIGIPLPTQQALLKGGFVTEDLRWNQAQTRHWVVRDGDERFGRLAWETPFPAQLHNWGLLWKELRKQVDDISYKNNVVVSGVRSDDDGVELLTTDQNSLGKFDVVIAADGSGSLLRKMIVPDSNPSYSGTVLWRGAVPLEELSEDHKDVFVNKHVFASTGYQDGHGIFYCIPKANSNTEESGSYLLNIATYTHTPRGVSFPEPKVVRELTPDMRAFFEEVVLANLPPLYQEVVEKALEGNRVSIHPVFDESPDRFVDPSGRIFLLGDAGAILRPHTASGTTKAIQDVFCLRDLCSVDGATWDGVAVEYQKQRKVDADNLVALGQRLGEAQVVHTPDWAKMTPEDYQEWVDNQTSGTDTYMYRNKAQRK